MEEKQYGDYFVDNNEPEMNNNEDDIKIDIPNYKAILCFGIGWIGISIIATLIYTIIGLFIDLSSINEINQIKIMGLVNFACYLVVCVSLLLVLGKPVINKLLKQFKNLNNLGKGLMYGFILLGSSVIYYLIVLLIYPDFGSNANQNTVVEMIKMYPVLSFFSVALFAPIAEEITYRLGLAGTIAKKSKVLAIVVSSLLFGLIHSAFIDLSFLSMTKQEIINEAIALPSYIISGLVMGIAYIKEDSLAVSITAHMTNNFIAFIQSFIPIEELFRLF